MKLLPRAIEMTLPKLYATEPVATLDKMVRVKFFTPWSNWTWLAVEYAPADRLFFGLVRGLETEWGYFALDELQSIVGQGGLRVERDMHFKPRALRELIDAEGLTGLV